MTKHLVYKTTNLVNGRYYIGKHSCNRGDKCKYLGSGRVFKLALAKYGRESFSREVLAEFGSEAAAYEFEASVVTVGGRSYNLISGGRGGSCAPCQSVGEFVNMMEDYSRKAKRELWLWKLKHKRSQQVRIKGIYYVSIAEACKYLKLSHTTVVSRLEDPKWLTWQRIL